MPLFNWSEKFLTNVKELDEQHKKLVSLINNLHDAMTKGKGKEIMGKILNELADYTDYHFKTEEKLLEKHAYPDYAKQKSAHDSFTKKVLDLKDRYHKGQTTISVEVMNLLSDWLKDHILRLDKAYGPFLNEKGVK